MREIATPFGDEEGGATLDGGEGKDGRLMRHLKRVWRQLMEAAALDGGGGDDGRVMRHLKRVWRQGG